MTECKHNNESPNGSDAPQQAGLRPRGAASAASGDVDSRIAGEGDTSNTPSPKTISGGEDWLSLSLYVEHQDLKNLKVRLDKAKEASKFGNAPDDEIRIGIEQFRVMPGGGRLGSQSKGSWMSWRLQSELGVTFMLMDSEKPAGEQPNCSVRVTSQTLMQFTTKAIWKWIQDCLDGMGARLVDDKLSRVDACVDLPNVDVAEFVNPFRDGWIVSRARIRAEFDMQMRSSAHYAGSRPLGFTIGKGPISIRVYDKLTESQRSPAKLALLIANRWGGFVDAATRVEIQLRREKLKTFGVDKLEDWFDNRATICKRVMKDWCRLTDGPVDRNHANRAPLHPVWQRAIEQFAAWCDGPDDLELTPLTSTAVDASRLVKSALGNLISVFARNGKVLKDNKQFLHEVKFQLLDAIGERDIAEEVRRRAFEFGTS